MIDDYVVNISNNVEIQSDFYTIIEVSYCISSSLLSSLSRNQYNNILNNVRSFAIGLAGNNNNLEKLFISPSLTSSSSSSSLSLTNDTIKRCDIGHRSLQWIHFLQNIKQ